MKIFTALASFLTISQLVFAETSISPVTDPFPQPAAAELPCMVGFPISQNGAATIQYNSTFSPLLVVNPKNSDMLVAVMNQDLLQVTSTLGTTRPRTQEVAIATSMDGGNSWTTGSTLPLHLCLGGQLSNGQSVTALRYSSFGNDNGTLFMAGRYSDVQNQSDSYANSGIWAVTSTTGAATWNTPFIVSSQSSDAYQNFVGTADGTPDLAIDPNQFSNAYLAWDRPVYTTVPGYSTAIPMAGNIFFSRTNNFGATWIDTAEMYDITGDIEEGGQCTAVSLAAALTNQKTKAIVASFMRYYKKPTSLTFDKTVATTITDRVVVRSTDGGHHWDRYATVVTPFIYAQASDPTGALSQFPTYPAPDGSENSHLVVNPKSGRLYLMWQAGSLSIQDPAVAQFHPEIVISVSRNEGKKWTKAVTVSRTPSSLILSNPPAYQAFNGNIFFLPNNLVCFVYYDYRNFQANSTVASTDAWLAVYRETSDEHGGSTQVGLDFITEVRLTDFSFDAKIATTNSVNGIVSGLGDVLGIAGGGSHIYTVFPITRENDPSNISNEVYPSSTPQYQASVDFNTRLDVIFQKVVVATDAHEKND